YKSIINNDHKIKILSLAIILGGAFGNLFDRLMSGKVVDFINIGITENLRWNYIFNLADTFITLGMIMIIFSDFFLNRKNSNVEYEPSNNK
ncbi:MAG: signal peptidase II, partial [Candidatus Marinimicrobia bacterium]|nr:signal peptidase II [Candidatus Neomarinimicrobiota bacterium]